MHKHCLIYRIKLNKMNHFWDVLLEGCKDSITKLYQYLWTDFVFFCFFLIQVSFLKLFLEPRGCKKFIFFILLEHKFWLALQFIWWSPSHYNRLWYYWMPTLESLTCSKPACMRNVPPLEYEFVHQHWGSDSLFFLTPLHRVWQTLTPQCIRWIWQVSYCPRPSTPVQTFWKASAVYTYLFHLFPPKQLECKLRGNPSGESLTHTFQPTGWEDIIDMYVVNVDKHFMSPFIHFVCLLKKRKSVDVAIPTDTQDKFLCRTMMLKQLNSKHSGSLPLTYGFFLCTGGSSTHDLNECK